MGEEIKRAFVCGHPVSHSMSPVIHGYWLAHHNLTGAYEKVGVAPEQFSKFITSLQETGFVGGNITIPYKESTFDIVSRLDDAARHIGAVNTVWLEDGLLHGTNTDWIGFASNLDQFAQGWASADKAVVMGAGGAARGIVYALIKRGIGEIHIVNRTRSRADQLAASFSSLGAAKIEADDWPTLSKSLHGADLLVNTTSLGLDGNGEIPDISGLSPSAVVTDIVYSPLQTPLLKSAAKAGHLTVDGLGMLLHQAVPGFEKWFGIRPRVTDELRELVIAEMDKRH